jgi:transcriptional regulator with XRE-family HTH domain
VAENVRAVRDRRRLSQNQLAARLGELGRPMQASAVAKIESGDRRVDVDDLTALAVALNVSVARLLLPDVHADEDVHVVPGYSVPMWSAWQWAAGEHSLHREGDNLTDRSVTSSDLDYLAEQPVWVRVRNDHPLARAARNVVWAVDHTLRNLPGTPRGEGEKPASGIGMAPWLSTLEQKLGEVRGEAKRLADEVSDRG